MLEKTPKNLGLLIGILMISGCFSEKLFYSDRSACAQEIEYAATWRATWRSDGRPNKTSVSKKEMSM